MRAIAYTLMLCIASSVAHAQEPAESSAGRDDIPKVIEAIGNVTNYLGDRIQSPEPSAVSMAPMVLDLQRCVQRALSQNPQTHIADENANAAHARIGQAKAQWLPQVTGRLAYTDLEPIDYNQGFGSWLSLGSDLTPSDTTFTTQITMDQVLYAGGQISAAIKTSKYLAQADDWQKEAVAHQLTFDAKSAYYDCLLTAALVRVAEESVHTFERHLADAQQMFNVGMVSRFEVLRAETELGVRKADTVEARSGHRLAYTNLRRVLALPQDTPVDLVTELHWTPLTADVTELVQQALQRRPEIKSLEAAIRAAKQDLRRVKGQFKPGVAASADWQEVDGGGPIYPDGWTLTLGLEWDLCTGGRRIHEKVEAKAKLRSLEHQLEDIERLVELEVTSAFIRIEDTVAQIAREAGNVELGREGLRLAEIRFQEDVGTQAETLDAELALTSAETALVQALRDYAVAHAALEKAIGGSDNT